MILSATPAFVNDVTVFSITGIILVKKVAPANPLYPCGFGLFAKLRRPDSNLPSCRLEIHGPAW
jgi:hypothetical protein